MSVQYEQHAVLRNVNLEFATGSFTYLLGPSGSGKSTLLKLLYREIEHYQGSISIMGEDLKKDPRWKLRRKVATVFQSFELLDRKTVYENVALAAQILGMKADEIHRKTIDLIHKVGLEGKEDRFPHQISGGEQQRVAIARALLSEPHILLADEPTGNLDMEHAVNVMKLLVQLHEAEGITIIMATHSQELVTRFPFQKIRLQEGGVTEVVGA
ncbi:ATP-binding cassette domain-containing protein [Paenibacillus turpanensis]|uniref:ATP-binding cassette domain-containing protein n=1 Tax=Paenibacillus turpanensis TaxID=2689078 RepID=UPI001A9EA4CD